MPNQKYISFAYDHPQDIGWEDFIPVIELAEKEINRVKGDETSTYPSKDPDFHCEYIKKKEVSTPDFKTDEILETIDRCPICNYKFDSMTLSSDQFKQNLCNYLDQDKQNALKHFIFLHRRGEFEITFDVKKGNSKANDKDGYIEVMVTPNSLGIEIMSSIKVETAYDKQITVKLKVKDEKDTDGSWEYFPTEVFQLDFFATDNNKENFSDREGEAEGPVHCGQFVIVSRNCICEDWPTINSVIPADDFVGWSSMSGSCYQKAVKQIGKVNYKDGVGWNPTSGDLFQIYKDSQQMVNGKMVSGTDRINDLDVTTYRKRFEELIDYLKKESLSVGIPLIAGVDDAPGHPGNGDKTTDHFIVIVGMGKDADGCYLLFYDNAVSDRTVGTSADNKLYCDCKKYMIKGSGDSANSFISGSNYGEYTVTHIRKSSETK